MNPPECWENNTGKPDPDTPRFCLELSQFSRQSNIQFRHVVNDMILDPEKRKAMVKWLAEFDNVRYRCLAHINRPHGHSMFQKAQTLSRPQQATAMLK